MSTFQKAWRTMLAALLVHATLLGTKVYFHPSHSLLAVFHVGGAQAFHPAFIADERYPLDPTGTGTDGQQYLYVAHDPWARGHEMAAAIDAPQYRYGRILLPALAWGVCGGNSPCLPRAIVALNLVFVAGIAVLLTTLVAAVGASAWWGLLLACAGPLACATDIANVEVAGHFFGLLGVVLFARGRVTSAALIWALAALARESYLLVPLGYALSAWLPVLTRKLAREPREPATVRSALRVSLVLLAPLPWIAWKLYLRQQLPPDGVGAASNLALPLFGIGAHVLSFLRDPRVTGSTVVAVVVGLPLLVMMARHLLALRADRSGLALATALFVMMGVVAADIVWFRPGGFARALDFVYPGAVLTALRRRDRTTAWLSASSLVQTLNILLDHVFARPPI